MEAIPGFDVDQSTLAQTRRGASMKYPLTVIMKTKYKKKCCEKYRKGKQCKRCPRRIGLNELPDCNS